MYKIVGILFLFLSISVHSQIRVEFSVIDAEGIAIPYVDLRIDSVVFVQTNELGQVSAIVNSGKHNLELSAFGYYSKQVHFSTSQSSVTFTLTSIKELDEVVISGTLSEISKSKSPVAITVLRPSFFKKNPSPNIYGIIDQVNGIRTQMNCNVCNTGDIHINGMEGAYTMITIDGMPIVGGLSTVYGLQGIPSSLIERIEVIKGPASTLYGSEAVGGLINVITRNPNTSKKFDLDISLSTYLENNIDIGTSAQFGRISTLLGVNYFKYDNPTDFNGDNFTDVTLQNRISVFNKWNIKRSKNRIANVAFRYVYEDRWGGEMQWTKAHRGGDEIYGESIWTSRYEFIGNYQLPFKERIILQSSVSSHEQNSVYGDMKFDATQKIIFNQLNWSKQLGKNNLSAGIAYRHTFYDDNTIATSELLDNVMFNNPSVIGLPGAFFQNLTLFSDRSQLLTGMRVDYHPIHGNVLSPRLNYKNSPNDKIDMRFALGNGFRVVNLFAEEHAALTGAREVIIKEALKPETCYNTSFNVTRRIFTRFGMLTLDGHLFYTYFTNKINPNYGEDDDKIIYENLNGYAIYRGLNVDARYKFEFPLTINLGFSLLDAFQMNKLNEDAYSREYPMLTERVSGTAAISYQFRKLKMTLDYTSVSYGKMRLPTLENDFRPDHSQPFAIHNLKLTKAINQKFDLYLGVKNIFNFRPPANSIMRPFDPFDREVDDAINNPFGYTFDPSYVYAPNQGTRGYFGLTFHLE
ncbi:MAG: TonB-dependent receptor plug domain-containing protein [Flavobacteriales bacterium]|nr:TonB-dependent receptor plug domain-containing protein [Flavobacteriales bacterium]